LKEEGKREGPTGRLFASQAGVRRWSRGTAAATAVTRASAISVTIARRSLAVSVSVTIARRSLAVSIPVTVSVAIPGGAFLSRPFFAPGWRCCTVRRWRTSAITTIPTAEATATLALVVAAAFVVATAATEAAAATVAFAVPSTLVVATALIIAAAAAIAFALSAALALVFRDVRLDLASVQLRAVHVVVCVLRLLGVCKRDEAKPTRPRRVFSLHQDLGFHDLAEVGEAFIQRVVPRAVVESPHE
jgi:hypothetical protein